MKTNISGNWKDKRTIGALAISILICLIVIAIPLIIFFVQDKKTKPVIEKNLKYYISEVLEDEKYYHTHVSTALLDKHVNGFLLQNNNLNIVKENLSPELEYIETDKLAGKYTNKVIKYTGNELINNLSLDNSIIIGNLRIRGLLLLNKSVIIGKTKRESLLPFRIYNWSSVHIIQYSPSFVVDDVDQSISYSYSYWLNGDLEKPYLKFDKQLDTLEQKITSNVNKSFIDY